MNSTLVDCCLGVVVKNIGLFTCEDFDLFPIHILQRIISSLCYRQNLSFRILQKIQFLDGVIELDLSMCGRVKKQWYQIIRTMKLQKLNLSHCLIQNLNAFLPPKQKKKKRKSFEISKSLVSLNLSHTHTISKYASVRLRNIHIMFPKLQVLSLENGNFSASSDLKPIQYLSDLNYLNIKNNRKISCDRTLFHYLSSLVNLQILNLGNLPCLKFRSLHSKKFSTVWNRQLTYLNLNFCDQIDEKIFKKYFFNCSNGNFDEEGTTYPLLRTLNIARTRIKDLWFISKLFPNLCSLDISHNQNITINSIFHQENSQSKNLSTARFPNLQYLNALNCTNLDLYGLELLLFPRINSKEEESTRKPEKKEMKLYSLDLSKLKMSNKIIEHISTRFKETLERLNLNCCQYSDLQKRVAKNSRLPTFHFDFLRNLERLVELHLQFLRIQIQVSSSKSTYETAVQEPKSGSNQGVREQEDYSSFFFINRLKGLRKLDLAGSTIVIKHEEEKKEEKKNNSIWKFLYLDLMFLEFLNISHLKIIEDEGLDVDLSEEEDQIEEVDDEDEEHCFFFLDLSKLPKIKTLCMTGTNQFFKLKTFSTLIKKSDSLKLKTFIIKDIFITKTLAVIGERFRNIKILDLENSQCLKSSDLEFLPFSNLLELNLKNCKGIGDAGLRILSDRCSDQIIKLNVLRIFFTDCGIHHISRCTNLNYLKISISEMMTEKALEDLKFAISNLIYLKTEKYQ